MGKVGFWSRLTGGMTSVGKAWFYIVLLLMCFGGLYIGLWVSCTFAKQPIDVPYVTADNYYERQDELAEVAKSMLGEDGRLTMLLLGADFREGEEQARSDTLMVAFVDMETPSVSLLSIPRDTYVEINGQNTKINHAFAFGGEPLTANVVEDFLDVEIDRYLQVDFNGFSEMIDAIGGVDINVEEDMYKPEEGIDLKAGQQHLEGDDALAYVRWRGTASADIGRVERQQEFLKAMANQMMSLGTIAKLPKMMDVINDNVETDFTNRELISLFNTFSKANSFNIYSEMVQGEGQYINGVSYWLPFESMIPEQVARMEMTPAERAAAYPPETTDSNTASEE